MTIPLTACRLPHRGILRVGGDDRAAFLQGLISNDIALCTPKAAIHAALLTPQGKFLHDFLVYDAGDAFLLDCERERAADLLQRLATYKLRAKVTLEDVGNAFDVWAFPQGSAGLPDPRLPALGSRGVFAKGKTFAGYQMADAATYDRHRLALGVPDGSRDMVVGKSTLSDGNFDLLNGVSWTKGCYVGQELTARMHHRALVKKRMFPVRISGAAPVAGSIIYFNNDEIGEMRSSNGDVGLALLNIEQTKWAMKEGIALDCGNAKLTPHQPEWLPV